MSKPTLPELNAANKEVTARLAKEAEDKLADTPGKKAPPKKKSAPKAVVG